MSLKATLEIDMPLYHQIHHWLKKNYGKAYRCDNPNCISQSKKHSWALKRGKKYAFNRNNFLQLCGSCHIKYDFTEETRKKIRKFNTGKVFSAEHKKRMSESYHRPVIQWDLQRNKIAKFSSISDAARFVGAFPSQIGRCVNGAKGCKTCMGYKWSFAK